MSIQGYSEAPFFTYRCAGCGYPFSESKLKPHGTLLFCKNCASVVEGQKVLATQRGTIDGSQIDQLD